MSSVSLADHLFLPTSLTLKEMYISASWVRNVLRPYVTKRKGPNLRGI